MVPGMRTLHFPVSSRVLKLKISLCTNEWLTESASKIPALNPLVNQYILQV